MNYFVALPPAIALPSKLHTAYQKGSPLANGMDCHLVSFSANCTALMLSMNPAINVLIFTLHLQSKRKYPYGIAKVFGLQLQHLTNRQPNIKIVPVFKLSPFSKCNVFPFG